MAQHVNLTLAHLAQHPAHGLVHERMGVAEELLGEAQCVGEVVGAQEHPARDHGHALPPQVAARGEAVEDVAAGQCAVGGGMKQVGAEDFGATEVDEVPVVSGIEVSEVALHHFLAPHSSGLQSSRRTPARGTHDSLLHVVHQCEEAAEPHLVPGRTQQFLDLGQGHGCAHRTHHLAHLRHTDTEKAVALGILPRPRLEEAHQHLPLRGIGHGTQRLDHLLGGGCGNGRRG